MKRVLFILLTTAVLSTAGVVLGDEVATTGEAASAKAALTPATDAEDLALTGDEPLFLSDSVSLCVSLDPEVTCTATFSCSSTVVCSQTGTGVKYRTCTCCGPCTELPCDCDTSTVPVGCC